MQASAVMFKILLMLLCSFHFSFAQKATKSTITYEEEYFEKNGACKPLSKDLEENKTYPLSSECGNVSANIRIQRNSNGTIDVFFCIPQMNPSPLQKDGNKLFEGVYVRTNINTIKKENGSSFYIQKANTIFRSGPSDRKIVLGDHSITLHTLGAGGTRTLKKTNSKNAQDPDDCQIKIEHIGANTIVSGGGNLGYKLFSRLPSLAIPQASSQEEEIVK